MTVNHLPPDRKHGSKTVLFCAVCDRAAPINEMHLDRHEDRIDIECTDCGAVLVSQPSFPPGDRRIPAPV